MALPFYRQKLAEVIDGTLTRNGVPSPGKKEIEAFITEPPSVDKGDLSLPVFKFMPKGQNPVAFALHLVTNLQPTREFNRF